MGMIGPEEVEELDSRMRLMFQTLVQSKTATPDDAEAARRFLEWVIYHDWDRDPKQLDVRPIEWSEGLNEFERPMLVEIARAAADLVRSGKTRDKAPLIERCRMMLKLRGVPFGEEEADQPAEKIDRRSEARDKFIYQKLCSSSPAKRILSAIDQHPEWDLPKSEAELHTLAVRYSKRHDLPLPPER